MREIQSGKSIFGAHEWGVLDMMGRLEPGLIVDAGAAAGYVSKHLLTKSPRSRTIAFEPFPGNWSFLEKNLADKNAIIVKQALADKPGEARFFVSSTAHTEGDWKGFDGYSSVGYILPRGKKKRATAITVPVTTVDEHVSEPIRFFKIDVQGGELDVLKGAKASFDRGIDLLYVEFSGETEILDFLHERDYVIFDHQYLLIPTAKRPDLSFWNVIKDFNLSTGQKAHYAWPKETPGDPAEFCAMFEREAGRVGQIQTDIVAVRPGFRPLPLFG